MSAAPPAVVELRQYTLHPGRRDALIALFEREFVESQEALGLRLLGLFKDLDDPDRFVWLRSFADMPRRKAGLEAFYGGPVWAANREAANATMVDSDDVLLLKPIYERPQRPDSGQLIAITVHALLGPPDAATAAQFETAMVPALEKAGAQVLAGWVTERAPNSFPRLPVREGENVLVWMAAFPDPAAHAASLAALEVTDFGGRVIQRLRLEPTKRSRVR